MGKRIREDITIVGLGPGNWEELTLEAQKTLMKAEKVFFREHHLPVFEVLKEKGIKVTNLDYLYDIKNIKFREVYSIMVEIVIKEAKFIKGIVFALPGNPFVLESCTDLILKEAKKQKLSVKIIPGMSFLETIFTELRLDPYQGLQFVNPLKLIKQGGKVILPNIASLIFSPSIPICGKPDPKSKIAFDKMPEILLTIYPRRHKVFLIKYQGRPSYKNNVVSCPLYKLSQYRNFINNFTSIYIPAREKS